MEKVDTVNARSDCAAEADVEAGKDDDLFLLINATEEEEEGVKQEPEEAEEEEDSKDQRRTLRRRRTVAESPQQLPEWDRRRSRKRAKEEEEEDGNGDAVNAKSLGEEKACEDEDFSILTNSTEEEEGKQKCKETEQDPQEVGGEDCSRDTQRTLRRRRRTEVATESTPAGNKKRKRRRATEGKGEDEKKKNSKFEDWWSTLRSIRAEHKKAEREAEKWARRAEELREQEETMLKDLGDLAGHEESDEEGAGATTRRPSSRGDLEAQDTAREEAETEAAEGRGAEEAPTAGKSRVKVTSMYGETSSGQEKSSKKSAPEFSTPFTKSLPRLKRKPGKRKEEETRKKPYYGPYGLSIWCG